MDGRTDGRTGGRADGLADGYAVCADVPGWTVRDSGTNGVTDRGQEGGADAH